MKKNSSTEIKEGQSRPSFETTSASFFKKGNLQSLQATYNQLKVLSSSVDNLQQSIS
jgi:hypothetical protein